MRALAGKERLGVDVAGFSQVAHYAIEAAMKGYRNNNNNREELKSKQLRDGSVECGGFVIA